MAVLQLRVEVPESANKDCVTYLDFDFVRNNGSLLQHVQQLAWDLLPDSSEIKATYLDDDGDICTLTDRTASDALSFASPQNADGNRILNISVSAVDPQDTQAEQRPLHVPAQEQEDTSPAGKYEGYEGYACDACKRGPIVGHRFHSLEWENFDLCGDCHDLPPADRLNTFGVFSDHKFEVIALAEAATIAGPEASVSAGPTTSSDEPSQEQEQTNSMPESTATEDRVTEDATLPSCFFGKKVLITSHRNQNLQDNNSNVRLHTNSQAWEQWTISDAGNGTVFIKSHRNHNLQDNYGSVKLHTNSQAWEQWTISDAGDGKVFISSHRNHNLQDNNNHCWSNVKLHTNTGPWEQWTIRSIGSQPTRRSVLSTAASQDDAQDLEALHRAAVDVAMAVPEVEEQTSEAVVHAMAACGPEEQHKQEVQQSIEKAERWAREADTARKEAAEAKQWAQDQVQKMKEENQRVLEQAQEDVKSRALEFENYIEQTNEHKRELAEEREELKQLAEEAKVESASYQQQVEEATQCVVEIGVQLAWYKNEAEEAARRVVEIEEECVKCRANVVGIEAECVRHKEEVEKAEEHAQHSQKTSNESQEAKQKAEQFAEELQQRCLDLESANKNAEQQIEALTATIASAEAQAVEAEKTAHKAQLVKGSPGLSALVQDSSPLTVGIEAEEVQGVRGDVTREFTELVTSFKARQAFRIGRVCLTTSVGGAPPSVPACSKVMVQNDGTASWPQTTVVVNVAGPDMGLPIMALGAMQPGEVAEIEMDLEVPSKPEACSETRSSWAIIDAATGAQLGPLLVFEAAWSSPE